MWGSGLVKSVDGQCGTSSMIKYMTDGEPHCWFRWRRYRGGVDSNICFVARVNTFFFLFWGIFLLKLLMVSSFVDLRRIEIEKKVEKNSNRKRKKDSLIRSKMEPLNRGFHQASVQ